MNNLFLAMYLKLQSLMNDVDGQDLVEYALLIALIGVAVITASQNLATAIVGLFVKVTNDLT